MAKLSTTLGAYLAKLPADSPEWQLAPLQSEPLRRDNQESEFTFAGLTFVFGIYIAASSVCCDIEINDTLVASGVRAQDGVWLLDPWIEEFIMLQGGDSKANFRFETTGETIPWPDDFTIGTNLVCYSGDALSLARAEIYGGQ